MPTAHIALAWVSRRLVMTWSSRDLASGNSSHVEPAGRVPQLCWSVNSTQAMLCMCSERFGTSVAAFEHWV